MWDSNGTGWDGSGTGWDGMGRGMTWWDDSGTGWDGGGTAVGQGWEGVGHLRIGVPVSMDCSLCPTHDAGWRLGDATLLQAGAHRQSPPGRFAIMCPSHPRSRAASDRGSHPILQDARHTPPGHRDRGGDRAATAPANMDDKLPESRSRTLQTSGKLGFGYTHMRVVEALSREA